MDIIDIIIKKRDGFALSKKELDFFVAGVTDGSLPDYQVSALLMAMFLNQLNFEETSYLTMAMAHSGSQFDLSSIPGIKTDKHSTGGVADTTTLILAPLVASCGVPVIKMSGRGLGFSGGTLDKLESIPGFRIDLTEEEALAYAKKSGIVIMGQTDRITPADKKLYALRDVTGTVDNLSLIASSIMSKKIAAGCDAIVLDVKYGSGAFMKDLPSAQALAREMVAIGQHVGKKVSAVITSMEQPLGQNIGNALEVIEAIEVLKGKQKGDLLEVALTLGAQMLLLADVCKSVDEGKSLLYDNIENGKGLEKFRTLIIQQNGDPGVLDDYSLLGQCQYTQTLFSPNCGYIVSMHTDSIGRASLETGAGRKTKEDVIDPCAGIQMQVRIGDYVQKGQVLAIVCANEKDKCAHALEILKQAVEIGSEKPLQPKLIQEIIPSQ